MIEKDQPFNEQALQELRDGIKEYGWKDSVEFIRGYIQFVADLCAAGELRTEEVRQFRHEMQITIDTLMELRDGPYDEEIRGLEEAAQAFNRVHESFAGAPTVDGGNRGSLGGARDWRWAVDEARRAFEASCDSWRRVHLDAISQEHREQALRCIEGIESRIPLLRSGRLANLPEQIEAIEKGVILSGQLAGYADEIDSIEQYAEAIVHDKKRWAAFVEALIDSKWVESRMPSAYLKTVTAIKYKHVRPDVGGQDSQGFHHVAGLGGRIKERDALHTMNASHVTLEEMAQRPDEALAERRFTERSVAELQHAAEADPKLATYIRAVVRNPNWKRHDIWDSLGWDERVGKAVDRRYRRLRQRFKEIGAGMEWRVVPIPGMSEASQTTYFETLLDGQNGAKFGVVQHKLLKRQDD